MSKLQVVKTFEIRKLKSPYSISNYTKTYSGANTCFSTDRWDNKSQSYLLKDGQHICFRYLDGWENVWFAMGIDTNGFKGPNRYGYDVFEFKITDSLYPYTHANGQYCSYTSSFANHQSNGRHCAYYALKDTNCDDNSKGYWESLKF